ncbi:MAG: tyrosine-type recombinase/integrase, partial [Chloroflexota bacterium]
MHEQIEGFLNALREVKGYSNNTIVAYRNDLGQFLGFLHDKCQLATWGQVTQGHLIAYVEALKGEHEYASATVARKVAAAKSFFRHLVNSGVVAEDPSVELDSPKVRKYLPTSISEHDVARLLKAPALHNGARALRDAALLELLYATGMRVSEVVALDTADLDIEGASVHCSSKLGKARERVIPIYPRASDALARYLSEGYTKLAHDEDEKALFLNHRGHRLTRQGLWLIIKKYVDEVGIEA